MKTFAKLILAGAAILTVAGFAGTANAASRSVVTRHVETNYKGHEADRTVRIVHNDRDHNKWDHRYNRRVIVYRRAPIVIAPHAHRTVYVKPVPVIALSINNGHVSGGLAIAYPHR